MDLPEKAKGKVAEGVFKGDPEGGSWSFESSLDVVGLVASPVTNGSIARIEFRSESGTVNGLGNVQGTYTTPSGGRSTVNMPVRVGMGRLHRHPSETATGNAYGYEENVPYRGRTVDHISVAVGKSTRIVFHAPGKAFAKAIVGRSGGAFSVRKDGSKCTEAECELIIEGAAPTPTQASEEAGEMMYVHFADNDGVMVDSVMVNVYSGPGVKRVIKAAMVVGNESKNAMSAEIINLVVSSRLKYIAINADLEGLDQKMESDFGVYRLSSG